VEKDFCTWYAEERFHDYVSSFRSAYPSEHDFLKVSGNAYAWKASARANGWVETSTPMVDSIAVFQPGVEGADSTDGHVAWVTAVRSGGRFTADELNAYNANGKYNSSFTPDQNPNYHAAAGVIFILVPTS
jgi:surface antigen